MTTKDAQRIMAIASSWLGAGETLAKAAASLLGARTEQQVVTYLETVIAIVDSIAAGLDGHADVESANDHIQTLNDLLAANDRQADADLDSRFPAGP